MGSIVCMASDGRRYDLTAGMRVRTRRFGLPRTTPPPPPIWWLSIIPKRFTATLVLVVVLLGLVLIGSPRDAEAQQVTSQAVLHRDTIVEGQTRVFQITNVPTRPEYYLHASVAGSFSAEASDVTITTDNLLGQALSVTPDANGPRAYPDSVYGRIRFEVTANDDPDGAGDETFGVRLCTTADCTGGVVLGEWTVTITEPQADTTLSGTGATVTIPGGSAASVMEVSRNGDGRDRRATFSINITTAPTSDIAVVAYTETGVSTGTRMAPFARINSALSPDYPPHGETGHDNVQAEYLVGYWASGSTGTQDFTIISTDNVTDTAGGMISGNLKFKVLVNDSNFGGENGGATDYLGITIPDLPVNVTDDDEPTRLRLLPTSPADNEATEGNTDKATVLVKLDRALVAGEEVTALLTFNGAALGTNFSLAAQSGQTGVTYADSADGTKGLVTLAGAGAGVREGVIEVTALTDSDSDSQSLQIGMPPFDQPWRPSYHRSNLDGGVCAAHGCPDRPPGDPGQRFQSVTLAEAVPGLTITEHADPDARLATEGADYSYTLQLNSAPSNDVTVTTTIASGGTVTAGGTLTFTNSNYATPQTVTVQPTDNGDDEANRTLTVTHAFSGDTTYAALPNVTHDVTVLDDDATTVTMAGTGVRPGGNGSNISRIMVEGDATRVDRTLTISLGRALEDGEYVRVPLRVEAVANGNNPSLPDDPPDSEDGDPNLPYPLDPRRTTVESARGPRASANVAWPPIHNDVVMTATGTGVTYEHSNRYTPNHIGFRYIEFRGAGAQTATIVVHAQDGFDDGEVYDEAFAITFPNNFYVFDDDTDQPFSSAPVDSNLGGGVTASPVDGEAWFGIEDKGIEGLDPALGEVPPDWSLLPPGLLPGDKFRLLFVTSATRSAHEEGWNPYDNFVRAEITGNELVQGGVTDLATYASDFAAVISANNGGNASVHANLEEAGSDAPIYWVGGTKVADNKADFLDGSWDDEANPTHADGSAATISTNGYWTGSESNGRRRDSCGGNVHHLRAGSTRVNIGKLGDDTLTPLGPPSPNASTCATAPFSGDQMPLYALSTKEFFIPGGASIEPTASGAEGSAVSFTVTITTAAPSGGITIPYTLTDGRGVDSDPVRSTATSADYSDAASGSITIAQGATTGTITINATQDSTYEGDHYFTVTLGTPTGTDAPSVRPGQGTAVGTITDAADAPTFQFDPATASASETGGAATLTITKTGTTLVPSSVTWTTADGTGGSGATHPDDYTSATGTLQFGATDTSQTISIDITADSVSESAETFSVQLSDPVEATLGSATTATVTVNDTDMGPPPTVNVTISASAAVAVEGALAAAAPRLTVTISRALTQGQTVTVPLTFKGATEGDDYDLTDSITASGVSLIHTGSTHTRQNPAVHFTGSGTTAELRITFRDNSARTQPYLVVDYGTADRAPSVEGVTLGTVTGGPIGIVLEDNETGDIEVPTSWSLAPSGLSGGDEFRLLFRTSTGRDATSTDIADYDTFIREVLATGGHADILPYAGFFKVFGSTRSSSGSTGTSARVHNGMAAEHTSHVPSGGWTDGSAASSVGSTTVGTPIYWLNGAILANNYADMCDLGWSGPGSGVRSGFDADDPRSEDGTRNIPPGTTNYQPYSPWTGTGNACEAFNHPLGASTVSQGSADRGGGQTLLHQAAAANTQTRPLFGMSPVFKVAAQAAVPQLGFSGSTFSVHEGVGTVSVTVNVDSAPSANLTVTYAVEDSSSGQSGLEATSGSDFTAPSGSFTITAGATSGTISIMITDDNVFEKAENFRLRLTVSSGYTVDVTRQYAIVVIEDNDRADLTLEQASYTALESGGTVDVTVNLSQMAPDVVRVRLTLADGTATGASGGAGADFDSDQLRTTIAAGSDTATFSIPITNDSAAEPDETFTATLSKGSGGVTANTDLGDPHVATITIADDDHPQGLLLVPSATSGLTLDEGTTATYTVRLATAPTGTVTVTISGAGSGITVDTDPSMASDQNTLTFTTSNWYIAQEVTVSAGQDTNSANEMVTLGHAPTGGGYSSSHNADFRVTADDDETLGIVTVTEIGGTSVSEDQTDTDTYTIALDTAPAGNVVITATAGAGAQVSSNNGTSWGSTATLPFTPSDHSAKTITVRGVDDDVDNAGDERTVNITHAITTGDGGAYPTTLTVSPVSVTVTDNDTSGVTVTQTDGNTIVAEDGGTDTYTVALDTQPLSNVVVTLTSDTPAAAVLSSGTQTNQTAVTLTFTPASWGAKTVTVRGVNDDIDNANDHRNVTITQAVTTGDTNGKYTTSTAVANVSVRVNDDDVAAVTVTGGPLTVNEDQSDTGTYTVALATEPLSNVTITATAPAGTQVSDDGGSTWATSLDLVFTSGTSGTWNTTQTVTVRGVNDDIDNENDRRDVTITQSVTTGDTNGKYTTSTAVANVSVRVNDDDVAAVTVTGGPLTVIEDQSDTGTYTVALATQPLLNVTITATAPAGTQVSDDGGSTWGSSVDLVFTAGTSGNWGTAQTVTVRGEDDNIDNPGNQRDVTITHAITSGNGDGSRYTPTTPTKPGVAVTVNDDDTAPTAITLSVDDDFVGEGDGATSITVTATVQGATRFGVDKAVDVTVTPLADRTGFNYVDMTAVSQFTITIPAGAQSATGMFTLTPDDDVVDEVTNIIAVAGSISGDSATTINPDEIVLQDDDAAPSSVTLSVNPTSITENGGARSIGVTATVGGATRFGNAQTVAVSVAGHNADGRVKFGQVAGFNITINAEAATGTGSFTLTPTNNNWDELDGAAALSGTLSGVTVNGASVTITDDDAAPSGVALSVNRSTIAEGAGATTVTVTATVQGATRYGSNRTVTVSQMGSGNANVVDYAATAPSAITIPAGQASRTTTFTITPTDDTTDEYNETVTVSGTGAGISSVSAAAITLTDNDDTTVTISAPAGGIAENGGTKDVTLTLSRALVMGETVTVPLEVVGATAGTDYTLALHPSTQMGVALSQSGSDSAQQPKVTLTSGASTAVLRFTAVNDNLRQQPYLVVKYGTGGRVPSASGVDFAAPTDGPVGFVLTDDETGDINVVSSWGLYPTSAGATLTNFRLVFVTSGQRNASSGDIADYDHFIRTHLAEGHADIIPYAGFFTVLGSTSAVTLQNHASVTGSASTDFFWLGETTGSGDRRLAASNDTFRAEWQDGSTPSQQSVPRDESGALATVAANGYFTGSTAAGARSSNPLGSGSVTLGYLNDGGAGRAPLGSGHTASSTAPRSFYGLSPTFTATSDPAITVSSQSEGVTEGAAITFTIEADRAPPANLPINLVVSEDGNVVALADEGLKNGAVTIAANTTSVTYSVNTQDDSTDEPDGAASVAIGIGNNYVLGHPSTAKVTVEDNDAMTVSVSGGGGTVSEGSSTDYTVDPGRDLDSSETVTINFAPAGSATQGTDYVISCHGTGVTCTGPTGTTPVMTITGGSNVRRGTIRASAQTDSAHPEAGETAGISLRAGHTITGSGGTFSVSGTPSTFTISSVAPAAITASFGAATYSGTEASGSRTVTIPINLSAAAPQGGLNIAYAVHNSSTAASADYSLSPASSVSIAQGTMTANITVTITDDMLHEGSETIVLDISGGSGYSPGSTARTTVTITDDDAAPTTVALSVDDSAVSEGDGAQTITVTATVGGSTRWGTSQTVAVSVGGSGNSNVVGFTASPTTFNISIAAGAATGTAMFTLTPTVDNIHENSETITVSGTHGSATVGSATITLTDDDAAPTTVALSVNDTSVAEGDGAQTITVTATVGGSTRWGTAQTVAVSVAGSGGANVVGFTAQPSNFNISIGAGAATGTGTFTLTPTDNNTVENAETVTVSGTLSGVTVSSATITLTDDDTGPGTPVTVTLSASAGDSDGNAVEGASGATGYRTITITLGRALSGAETVTVPLTVVGATAATDYTFALQPSSQAGVTLLTSNPHSAQNPALRLAAGASSATLRLTPVNNSARTQPYVVTAYGTGTRVPSAGGGATLGTVTGGPIGVVLVDDETGDITVPASWGLKPSALGAGDDFRLLFRSSTTRDATSSDIADYDAFIHNVLATAGHADILPYAGFFKVFGSTRSGSGSTGTTARVHTGMAAEHNQHVPSGGWLDGSAASSVGDASVGTPIYWLNGEILANNYADLCDQALSSGSGVTTGWGVTDPRSEDGTQNNPNSPGQAQQAWTGTGNACEAYDYPLGNTPNVSRAASHETTWAFMHQAHSPRADQRPLYGMSPVFKVAGSTPPPAAIAVGLDRDHYNVREGTTLQVTLTAASASSSSATFTVNATAGTATSGDWSGGPWSVTLPANQTSVAFNVVIPSDTSIEGPERFTLTIASPPQGFTLGSSTATVQIVDVNVVPGNWSLSPTGLTTGQQFRLVFLGDPHQASDGNIATYDGWVQADAASTGTTPTPHADIQAYSSGFQMVGSTATVDAAVHTATGIRESGSYSHTAWTTPVYWLGGAKIADDHNDFWDGGWDNQAASHTRGPDGQAVSGASKTWTGTQTGATHATAGTASANPLGHSGSNVTQGRWGSGNNPINQGTEGKNNVRRMLAISQVFEVGATPATPVADFANPTSSVGEASGTTNVRLNLSPAPANAITVNYTLSGSATRGTDYTISGGSGASRTVSVPGGSTFVNIPVVITNDNAQENNETIVLTLNNGSGYNVGTTNAVHTRTITDDDTPSTPVADFAAATSTVGEASGLTNVRLNLNPAPTGTITVNYTLSGSATRGTDYTISGGSGASRTVSVPGGSTFVNIPVVITNDSTQENNETIILTLNNGTGYNVGTTNAAHTRTITDDDGSTTPSLSIRGGSAVSEGGNASFTITANPAPSSSITVRYTVTQSGQFVASGQLGSNKSRSLSSSSTTFTIRTQDDNTDEPNGSVTVRLTNGTGYTIGSPSQATVVINDDDGTAPPPVVVRPPTGGGGGGGFIPASPTVELGGLWSNGDTLWLVRNSSARDGDAVHAYDLSTDDRVEERDLTLDRRNTAPRGIWSDGTTLWIADSDLDQLVAYDLATGERIQERDLALAPANGQARGVWGDRETFWVLDAITDAVFSYDRASGELRVVYDLISGNGDPNGIWSDGQALWVSDERDAGIYAYLLPYVANGDEKADADNGVAIGIQRGSLVRAPALDYRVELNRSGNRDPRGLWSDREALFVWDQRDDRLYRYDLPAAIDARLDSLSVSGVDFGAFQRLRTEYEGVPADTADAFTVEAVPVRNGVIILIEPEDIDVELQGHQVAAETNLITVSVTSTDGSRMMVYRVRVVHSEACLDGAVAEGLSLVVFAGGDLDDLAACAEHRHVTHLYTIVAGQWVIYSPHGPDFLNERFALLFEDGVPLDTPLIAASRGPATADRLPPADESNDLSEDCFVGDSGPGLGIVRFQGGSLEQLTSCGEAADILDIWTLSAGEYVNFVPGAHPNVNADFAAHFSDGIPIGEPLLVRGRERPSRGQ